MKLKLGGARGRRKSSAPVPRRRLAQQPTHTDRPGGTPTHSASSSATFRRNRTLTGSTSRQVPSSTELSGTMQSPRATVHHLRRRRRRLALLLGGGLIGALMMVVLLSQFAAEVRVAVVGQVRPLTEAQQQRIIGPINDYYATRPLERLRMLLNRDQLTAYLQANDIREVERIDALKGDGWGRAVVEIKVREPVARWSIGRQERFVDRTGAVFAVNYFDTPTVAIRDESGITTRSEAEAQAVTSGRFLAFVGRAVGTLRTEGLQIDAVVIPPATTRQVHLVVAGKPSVPIKMTIDRSAGEQSEDALRAWRHLAGGGQRSARPQYIDVRVSGMAYYRR